MKGALMGAIFGSVIQPPMPKAVDFSPRAAGDMPLPALLASAGPVEWAGEARFGNGLGGLVNRMGGRKARIRARIEAAKAEAAETQPHAVETPPAEPAPAP